MILFPNGIKGLSDSKWSGVVGSAFRLVGIDIHSTPGLIKVHQKLTKNSPDSPDADEVDELCKQRIAVSDGSTLWFSAESGKIWRESAGVWALKHTTVPTSGGASCLGAHEFERWIYWATESYLHRIHVEDIAGDWSNYVYENYYEFTIGDDAYHPMLEQNLDLFIGDKTVISKIAAPTTADANPSDTLSTTLGSSVKWLSLGFLVNPSELAFPTVRVSERAAYPVAGSFAFNSLVVGGGGGGGAGSSSDDKAGGGGAGGFEVTSHTGITEGSYAVTVGAGGAGGTGGNGASGSSSSFAGLVTMSGGGGGAFSGGSNGVNGASGGGASGNVATPGTGIAGQGHAGGNGSHGSSTGSGGGGGGAGAVGTAGSGGFGGAGGAGTASSISGSSVTYAGGGGGGGKDGQGAGGTGGGGSGGGAAATANTGSGGGGGSAVGAGGAGASGVVIISYPTGSVSASGGTITTSGGNTIHRFTSSGTFVITRQTLTKSITVPTGHKKVLFVIAANYTSVNVSGVTFDGNALTEVFSGTNSFGGGPTIFFSLYRLVNPEAKTGDVVATWATPTSDMLFHAFVCDSTDQTNPVPIGAVAPDGTSTLASATLSPTKDYQLRVAAVLSQAATHTPDDPQIAIQSGDNNAGTDSTSYLGTSVASTLEETDFNIKDPERITTLFGFDVDALIGTKVEGRNLARVLRWDTASPSWSAEDVVEENGVNAFIRDDNYVYVQTGEFGKLFFYNGEQLVPYQRIPGEWSPTKRAIIHQGAVATLLGVPVFGLSNLAGNPALQGVYSFGSYSKDYPKVLNLSFPISSGEFEGMTIGAALAVGADLYVAWKGATAAGVDKLDYSAKYGSAYIETMMLAAPNERGLLKTALETCAYYASLPASTGVTFSYKKKYDGSYASITPITDAKLCAVKGKESIPEVANLQLKFGFTVNSNDAPEVESFAYELSPLKK